MKNTGELIAEHPHSR